MIEIVEDPRNREALPESLRRELVRIVEWCSVWEMKLISSKTKSMVASRSRTVAPRFPALDVNDAYLV